VNALDQLKELVREPTASHVHKHADCPTAYEFVRDRGADVVELVEADEELRRAESEWYHHEVVGEGKYDPAEGVRRENRLESARARQRAALEKFTRRNTHPHIDDFGATVA
jgi:hypothetical protein